MYKKAVLYENIEKLIDSVDIKIDNEGTEMDDVELAFLCGIIQEKKPKKILELGVSAGGTTVVILKCIEKLGLDTSVISIDKAEKYYIDSTKGVGYLVEENKQKLRAYSQWKLCSGRGAERFIEDIGKGIDLCIIDTAHRLPGEVLDFLICYPYLEKDAVVVIHDLLLNHFGDPRNMSSKILFDTVVAEKYLMWGKYEPAGYPSKFPNISAFEIVPETGKYISDVLSSLTLEWGYNLTNIEIREIRDIFRKNYGEDFGLFFEEILILQSKSVARKAIRDHIGTNDRVLALINDWKMSRKTALYGAGVYCRKYLDFAKIFGLNVDVVVVSDDNAIQNVDFLDCPIYYFSELDEKEEYGYIICINDSVERDKIEKYLLQQKLKVFNRLEI